MRALRALTQAYPGRRSALWIIGIIEKGKQPALVAPHAAGELELQQDRADDRRRGTGEPDQVVDADRGRSEQLGHARARARVDRGNDHRLAFRRRPGWLA